MNFASDNAYGALPEVWAAIHAADHGTALAYGNDMLTKDLTATLIFHNKFTNDEPRDHTVFECLEPSKPGVFEWAPQDRLLSTATIRSAA